MGATSRYDDTAVAEWDGKPVVARVDPWSVWAIASGDDTPVRIFDATDEADALAKLPRDLPAVTVEGATIRAASGLVTVELLRTFAERLGLGLFRAWGSVRSLPRCAARGCPTRCAASRSDTPPWAVELCALHRRAVHERTALRPVTPEACVRELRERGALPRLRRAA